MGRVETSWISRLLSTNCGDTIFPILTTKMSQNAHSCGTFRVECELTDSLVVLGCTMKCLANLMPVIKPLSWAWRQSLESTSPYRIKMYMRAGLPCQILCWMMTLPKAESLIIVIFILYNDFQLAWNSWGYYPTNLMFNHQCLIAFLLKTSADCWYDYKWCFLALLLSEDDAAGSYCHFIIQIIVLFRLLHFEEAYKPLKVGILIRPELITRCVLKLTHLLKSAQWFLPVLIM